MSRSDALSSLKLRRYSKGENFSRFCERFVEYVCLTGVKSENLHLLLLQSVDDETYSRLKTVELAEEEKCEASRFCQIYKAAIYQDEELMRKMELLECQQQEEEDVDQFVYRLREKANIAFSESRVAEDNCLLAFLRGIKSVELKRKLNEASLESFSDAVALAKRLTRAAQLNEDVPVQEIPDQK